MHKSDDIVLYVDDEDANRLVFARTFGSRFNIKCVASAAEALELLDSGFVAVVVTDQRMPVMGGNELLRQVKARHPQTIRIAVTAHRDIEPILDAINNGLVARYVVKPWDDQAVVELLVWAVEAYRAGVESSALQLRLLKTERLVTLGSIGAAVVHDINQPLSYLTGNSERLQTLAESAHALAALVITHAGELGEPHRRNLADLAEELPEIADDMLAGCGVIRGLTRNLRAMLRSDKKEELRPVEPMPVVRFALSVCQEVALRSRAAMAYDGPIELPKLRVGSTELSQVLINLLSNGAQAVASDSGSGGRVALSAEEHDDKVCFSVTDNGVGMGPDVVKRLGTPFFSTREDGIGLGIAQSRRIVERRGGELHIDSIEGQGTTVRFTFLKA